MNTGNLVNQPNQKKLLRDIRKQLNLTQSELAEYLGVERARLSNLENGKSVPDWLIKAIKLNDLLQQAGYSIADLSIAENQDQLNVKNGNS